MLARLLSRERVADGVAPRLDPGRCVRGRFTRASCRRCEEACPQGAIEIGKGVPLVTSRACGGCRLCQGSCPTGALGDPEELGRAIAEMGDRPRPVLGCRVPGVEAHGRVACLGLLDSEALLALARLFPRGLTLNLVHCSECHNGAIVPVLRRSLEKLASLPGGVAYLRAAESRETLGYEHDALSRREFFSLFRGRARTADGASRARAQPTAPEPYSAKRLPAGRRALLRVLDHLPLPARAAAEVRFFPSLSFSPECRGCTGCAGVCPTGALTTTDAGERPRPVFEASACTGCGVCVEFCRRRAPVLSTGHRGATAAVACG